MKIFVSEFKQESNSFNPTLTDAAGFERLGVLRGEELLSIKNGLHITVKGIIDGIIKYGGEVVPGIAMCAGSGGPIHHDVLEQFLKEISQVIQENGPFDAVVLSLHGATITQHTDDACGDILACVRKLIGDKAILSASCDLHANITEKMLENADFLTGFHTYPHLDFYETGNRAACLCMQKLAGRPLKMVRAAVPMMVPPTYYTTDRGEIKKLMNHASAMVEQGKIIDYSIFQVQPWLDVSEITSTILVIGEDEATAKICAMDLALHQYNIRNLLQQKFYSIEEVIELARNKKTDRPILLVDSADSPNAGATCDSAEVLKELIPHAEELSAAFPLSDYEAVEQAFQIGVGNFANFSLGAKIAPSLTQPVMVNAEVKSLHKGVFQLEGPANRGGLCNIGRSAVLSVGKIQILVCNYATKIGDPQFYKGFGIDPSLCDLVVVKACTSFRASYEPVSESICLTQTPGAANSDLKLLPYTKLPYPLFPFDEIKEEDIKAPKRYR
ncbi:MAG: M81 family metallopeptidase [Lutisporaceae bacterium]|jgi:microcystin degradation protein MlrC